MSPSGCAEVAAGGRNRTPIYLDHAATTPIDPDVLAQMTPYFGDVFANPATIYAAGAEARGAVDEAREAIAEAIGAAPEEIYFTSGGTESDNWAVKGRALYAGSGAHILTTPVEHSAILEPCESLAAAGFEVEYLPVDGEGMVDPADVARRIRRSTAVVSVMHANNEVGAVEPIAEIGAVCRERDVPFHVDAVQSLGRLPFNVRNLNVDLASFSAHKLYGPKGVGALYVRRGTRMARFMEGGEQERGRRAGTLNVPGIVGFAAAVQKAIETMAEESARLTRLRDRFIGAVLCDVPGARLCGPREQRLPNNAHFCVEGVEGEPILLGLDQAGIYASAGSACSSGSTEPSHVLKAMGIPAEASRGALRFTLGRSTTWEDLAFAANRLAAIVGDLRSLEPVIQAV